MELLKSMFGLTYCEFQGQHYALESGTIGLGATGEIAIICMEEFQIRAMETSLYPLSQWYWYVDGSEKKCQKDQQNEILKHLNSIIDWFPEAHIVKVWASFSKSWQHG